MTIPLRARDLGARGSRGEVAGPDPAGAVPQDAAAILAAVPGWWACLASEAGLSGSWLDVSVAVDSPPPEAALSAEPEPHIDVGTAAEALGAAYVAALSPQVRARHGRHYTPADLASHLWRHDSPRSIAHLREPRGSPDWSEIVPAALARSFFRRSANMSRRPHEPTLRLLWRRCQVSSRASTQIRTLYGWQT